MVSQVEWAEFLSVFCSSAVPVVTAAAEEILAVLPAVLPLAASLIGFVLSFFHCVAFSLWPITCSPAAVATPPSHPPPIRSSQCPPLVAGLSKPSMIGRY